MKEEPGSEALSSGRPPTLTQRKLQPISSAALPKQSYRYNGTKMKAVLPLVPSDKAPQLPAPRHVPTHLRRRPLPHPWNPASSSALAAGPSSSPGRQPLPPPSHLPAPEPPPLPAPWPWPCPAGSAPHAAAAPAPPGQQHPAISWRMDRKTLKA